MLCAPDHRVLHNGAAAVQGSARGAARRLGLAIVLFWCEFGWGSSMIVCMLKHLRVDVSDGTSCCAGS
jgi:hypothetical protein